MNIYAKKGDKVRFLNKNGYDWEPKNAIDKGLVKGGIYTVQSVEVGGWMSYVTLKEFPLRSYNTVMFEDVKLYTEAEYTDLKQENLMRLGDVKILMGHRAEAHEKLKAAYIEISRLKTAYEAEKEARLTAEKEKDVLPLKVAEAIEFYKSHGFDHVDIYKLGCEGTDGRYATAINNWLHLNGSKSIFMCALVNGYTVEPEKSDDSKFIEGYHVLHKRISRDNHLNGSQKRAKLADHLNSLAKQIYSKN